MSMAAPEHGGCRLSDGEHPPIGSTVTTMNEVFPIAAGLLLGALVGYLRPRTRTAVGVSGAIGFGALATIASGEYRVGWEFLLVDVPLVALSTAAAFLVLRTRRRRSALR